MIHQAPFLRITWPVAAGVVARELLQLPVVFFWPAGILCGIGILCYVWPGQGPRTLAIRYNAGFGVAVTVCLFCMGYVYTASGEKSPSPFRTGERVCVKVRLAGPASPREKTYRIPADVLYDENGGAHEKVLLYFSKELPCRQWEPGDELTLRLKWSRMEGPKNPGEFDLETYNRRKGIFYRAFVAPGQVLHYSPARGFSVWRAIHRAGRHMMALSAKYFNSPSEKAVADALILGYQDDLDEETVNRFSRSGTSHVLAVSGLHVGILWVVVDALLFFMDGRRNLRILKFFVSLSILWGYAVLTGLSPSVMRSAVMFSGFAAGGIMKRGYSSMNMLCVSALLQVLLDPMVVFNAGFLLSYAAVAGILVFHPLMKNGLYFRGKYTRMLWEMVSLTLAAQLATAPVSLYFFGQFPVWFVFSNLPLVPLSGLALQLGLAAYVLEWVPHLGGLLFHLFVLSVKVMDGAAAFFADLPMALLYFRVEAWEAVWMYALIVTVTLFVVRRKAGWFRWTAVLVCIYLAGDLWRERQAAGTHNWVAYALKNGTVLRHHSRHDAWEYRSDAVDRKSHAFSVKPSEKTFATVNSRPLAAEHPDFIMLAGKRIVLLKPRHLQRTLPEPVACDWIVLESVRHIDFDRLGQNFTFSKLFIAGGNSPKARRFWRQECVRRRIPFYDLQESGAWIAGE